MGRSKKKKKAELTPEQQEEAALEKAATALRHSFQLFRVYVNRLDQWLLENHQRAIKMFQMFDVEQSGRVTYAQFKSGMLDLLIPCSKAELHLLCKLLDRDDYKTIEFNRVARGLSFVWATEERNRVENIRSPLRVQFKQFERCNVCEMRRWNGETYTEKHLRFVDVTLRLLTFEDTVHPGHIKIVVHSHLTVFHLGCLVRDVTGISSTLVVLYAGHSVTSANLVALDDEMSLEECGYVGGPQHKPVSITLYYDFVVEPSGGDPLLMCDHYLRHLPAANKLVARLSDTPLGGR